MERNLNVERLYFLGDFRNIKFSNALTGIPEKIAMDEHITSLLFFSQALACEIAYTKYHKVLEKIAREKIQDVLGYLEQEREQTLKELYNEINEKMKEEK